MEVAEQCDLVTRALRCEMVDLPHLKLPAILHWDMNHYVVVTRVGQKSIWIHDPAMGMQKLSFSEFSNHFTGIALEVSQKESFKPVNDKRTLSISQLWSKASYFYRSLGMLFLLSMLIQVVSIVMPYYMQWVVDHVMLSSDRDMLTVLAIGFGLVMLCGACVSALRSWLVLRLSSVLSLHMGVNLLSHLLFLPLDYFQKRHVGDVVSRFQSLAQVRERITTGVVETIVDGVMSLLMLAIMLMYSVQLTTIVLCAVALYILIRGSTYHAFYRQNELSIKAGAVEQTGFLENVRAIQAIKLMSSETQRLALWQNQYTDVINSEIRIGRMNIGFGFVSGLIFGVENIFVIYLATLEVFAMNLSVGMVLAFIAYKNQLSGRLTNLVEQWIGFRMLKLHLERLADIALTPPEGGAEVRVTGPMTIEAKQLGYRYGENEQPVLKAVNLIVPPGSMLAIVGPSGGGKTTLVKLLLGLIQPTEGKVTCNGIPLGQLMDFRQQIGAVMQRDQLLAGSVSDNISFFDVEADQQKLEYCAHLALVHDDIVALPMGYQSLVGDMGNVFSGGQVQRLLLARALYREPKILFLDEATSHLDALSEQLVSNSVRNLPMTKIVVAHRQSTIKGADQVLYVSDGDAKLITPDRYFAEHQVAQLREADPVQIS